MSAATIQRAIEAVEDKGIDTDLKLYNVIDKRPGVGVYVLAKVMGWSTGKTYASVRRLEKAGLVHVEKALKGGRNVLMVKPVEWQEFFTPEELEEMRQPGFMDEVEAILKKASQ